MSRSDEQRRLLVAGAILAALALAVVFGAHTYRWVADAWAEFTMDPIERVHIELLPLWALSVSGTKGVPAEDEPHKVMTIPRSNPSLVRTPPRCEVRGSWGESLVR